MLRAYQMTCLYLDINVFAFLLLQQVYTAKTYEQINHLFDVYSYVILPPDWDGIIAGALQKQRIKIDQMWYMQRLREAGL